MELPLALAAGEVARLSVWIPMEPKPKPAPQARVIKLRNGRMSAQMYTPAASRKWQAAVSRAVREHLVAHDVARFCGPLSVTCDFVRRRPGSRPQPTNVEQLAGGQFYVSRAAWKTGGRLPCPTRPDVDNYQKNLFDALTAAGVWWDDGQVVFATLRKWYAAKGEAPGIRLLVEPV